MGGSSFKRAHRTHRLDQRAGEAYPHVATGRGLPAGGPQAAARALARLGDARAVVLVEGFSDQIALETLGQRRGRDLAAERVAVVPIGGAQAVMRFLARFGRGGPTLVGLCDAGEEPVFRRALERCGFGSGLTRADMERLGFFVCVEDLEDELIRALGPDQAPRPLAGVLAHV